MYPVNHLNVSFQVICMMQSPFSSNLCLFGFFGKQLQAWASAVNCMFYKSKKDKQEEQSFDILLCIYFSLPMIAST